MASRAGNNATIAAYNADIDRTKEQESTVVDPVAVQVVAARPGVTTLKYADGTVAEVSGNRNVRNNNPGNIEYGNFAKALGAIGTDGRFAVFPTKEAGTKAQEALLFGGANYKNKTLTEAIARWAPPSENNTTAYQKKMLAAVGGANKKMSEYSPAERANLLTAMQIHEGYNGKAHTIKTALANAPVKAGDAGNISTPASQLPQVIGYNSQMVQAAQKIADNNLAAVNNFNWNPNTADSSAQRFGKTVSANTDALSQVYDTNMREMQAFTNPTADTYLGRVGDKLGAMWNVSGNTLTERYLKRAEANQSGTGKAMAEQVANMKSVLDGTVINPAFLDKAAGNLTQQQQVENQTYNAVTDNANTQQQLKQQLAIANMQNETEQAKIALATQKANGVVDNPDDSSLVNAARSLGIQLPEGMKTSDIKATLGDKLAAVQAVAANNGSLGSDPYTAVQTVKLLGNAAPPELVRQAQIHENFQASILASKGYKEIPVPLGASKEQAATISAQNDNAKRVIINKAYQEAANNEGGLATLPGNPYSSIGGDTKTLANGLPVPKGIAPEEVGKLTAVDFISKASAAGATSVEIANFYKGLNTNATKDTNFKVFNAPAPSGKFVVQLKGVDDKMDLATPAGVERFKALMKSNQVKLEPTNSFAKFLSAGVDFFDPQAYISGNKTGQFGYNNNLVDQVTGKPQVTLNPK